MSSATTPSSDSLYRYDDYQDFRDLKTVLGRKETIAEIAGHFEVSDTKICRWLIRFGLLRELNIDKPYKESSLLEAAYTEAETIRGTAEILECSSGTARRYLMKYGLYEPKLTSSPDGPVRAKELENSSPEDIGLAPIGMRCIGGEIK